MQCTLAVGAVLFALSSMAMQVAAQTVPAQSLPNGIRVQSAGQLMEVTALRDDVLRVRVWPEGSAPENASWAVLPAALLSTAAVTPETHGFGTAKLHLVVGPNLALTVSDLSGHVLQQDGAPIVRRGKLKVNKPLMVQPSLEVLPVYVRGGSILPIEPLTQSTEERPVGPLTLRIYPATDLNAACAGEVYTDDGHTFGYRKGNYARVRFSCSLGKDGSMSVQVGPQEGSFAAWWTQYRLEIYGWTPQLSAASLGKVTLPLQRDAIGWSVTIPANVRGEIVQLR
jgi:hypothetical protein